MNLNEAKVSKQLIDAAMNDRNFTFGFEAEFFYTGVDKFLESYLGRNQEYDEASGWYTKQLEESSWHDVVKYFDPMSISSDIKDDNIQVLKARLTASYQEITKDESPKTPSEMFATLLTELSMPVMMALLQVYPKNGFVVTDPQQNSLTSVFRRGDIDKANSLGKLNKVPYRTYEQPGEAFNVGESTENREIFYEIFAHQLQKYLGSPVKYVSDELDIPKVSNGNAVWVVAPDSSLEETERMYGDNIGIEIISPVMFLGPGLMSMEKIFNVIKNPHVLGFKNLKGVTDQETGFHINLGVATDEIDYLKLMLLMGDQHALEQYGRGYNPQAVGMVRNILQSLSVHPERAVALTNQLVSKVGTSQEDIKNAMTALKRVIPEDKFSSINLQKLLQGYVEFRHAGGEDYHENFEMVKKTVMDFAAWLYVASHDEIYKKDYYKALFKFLQTIKTGEHEELGGQTFVNDVEFEQEKANQEKEKRAAFFARGRPASEQGTISDAVGTPSPGPTGYFSGEVEDDKDIRTVDLP